MQLRANGISSLGGGGGLIVRNRVTPDSAQMPELAQPYRHRGTNTVPRFAAAFALAPISSGVPSRLHRDRLQLPSGLPADQD